MQLAEAAIHIRARRPGESAPLLDLWERSVRATHTFLSEEDILFYRPLVAEFLSGEAPELYVVADDTDAPIGFLGLAGQAIDALFLDPSHRGRGIGRRLVAYAQERRGGALTVDVNEKNGAARGFYEAQGFEVVGKSLLDGLGRPHPLLHLRRDAPIGRRDP